MLSKTVRIIEKNIQKINLKDFLEKKLFTVTRLK